MNGHIIGFRPQTQKLESPYKTPSITLAVKGLNKSQRMDCPQKKVGVVEVATVERWPLVEVRL